MEKRKELIAENPSMKSDIGGVSKLIGKAWKELSAAEKEKYSKKGASMKTKKKSKMSKISKMSKVSDEVEVKKTRKSGKKRALSGFMKFCQKERASVMKENPNIKFTEVGKELGKRWQALSEGEKKKFA
jgi:hypothetical protein